jgi:hypothetical protein
MHLQWLSQYTPAQRQARRQAARDEAMARLSPTPKQLAYLVILGDTETRPTTMLEASKRIDLLARKVHP